MFERDKTFMSNESKSKVQFQFGTSASAYANSQVHSRGESLALLVRLVNPQHNWLVLDVAAGAGHTAFIFAPYVKRVIATDLTKEMVAKSAELAAERGLHNVETSISDAETLPFGDASFNLVTCRLGFHHFFNPCRALSEFGRVLKQDDVLGFTDNVTVSDEKAIEYHNAYEKLRDPSHHWVFPLKHLLVMFEKTGFEVTTMSDLIKEFEFNEWTDRQHVSDVDKEKLLKMMRKIPSALKPYFKTRWTKDTMYFSLKEVVIIARKKMNF